MWIVNYCGFYFISWTLDSGLEFEMWIMVVLTLFEDLHQPRLPYHLPAQDLLHQHFEEGHRLQGQDGTGSQLAQMLGKSDDENFFQWPGISCQDEAEDFTFIYDANWSLSLRGRECTYISRGIN